MGKQINPSSNTNKRIFAKKSLKGVIAATYGITALFEKKTSIPQKRLEIKSSKQL